MRPQSEQERQAAVVRAEGEAEAATIISKALSKAGDGLVQFRRIEASKEIAGTLANVGQLAVPVLASVWLTSRYARRAATSRTCLEEATCSCRSRRSSRPRQTRLVSASRTGDVVYLYSKLGCGPPPPETSIPTRTICSRE